MQSHGDVVGRRPAIMNRNQVRKVIRQWEKAIQAGEMGHILANHTRDVLMFDVPEPLESKGIAKYQKTWELFFRYGSPAADVFVIENLKITAGSSVAFATGLLRIGGSKEPVCRLTLGLKKQRGRWLIAHEHHSAPHKLEN
jgi:ketosteroid isomerase-like protein